MKKVGFSFLICLCIILSFALSEDSFADGVRYNPESVDIYCLSGNYDDELLSSFTQRNYASSYQIKLGDNMNATPKYEVISGNVNVSSTGVVTPYYISVTRSSTGITYKEYHSGTAKVKVTCGDYSEIITINTKEYSDIFVEEKIAGIVETVISDGMTEYEKLEALTKWIADNTIYSGKYQACKDMLIYECGDCWASTNTLVALCNAAGIQAKDRSGYMDGSDSHENVIAKCDGEYYVAEAGYYSTTKPRMYSIESEPGGFAYTCDENKVYSIYQYDGFETEVVIPETIKGHTITRLGLIGGVFNNDVTSVTIPKTIDTISDKAFTANSALTSITVSSENKNYESENGMLYTKGKGKLIFVSRSIDSISIDPATTEIGEYVFSGMTLENLTIPGTVNKLGNHALYNSKIGTLVIEEGVKVIDEAAFSYSQIDEINLPSSITSLGSAVFSGSTASKINIPDGVTEIPLHAFSSCKNLKELTIKKSVTKIGNVAFQQCNSLDNIYYEGTEEEWLNLIGSQNLPSNTVVRFNPVRVTGISIDEPNITMEYQNEKRTLNATVLPVNASNQDIKYLTSDVNVVNVSGNSIYASGEGSCTVKAVTADGEYEATYNVTVSFKRFKLSVVDGKIASPSDDLISGKYLELLPGTRVVVSYSSEKCDKGYTFTGWESTPNLTLYSGTMTSSTIIFYMPRNDLILTGRYSPILITNLYISCSEDEMCAGNSLQISSWHNPANVCNDKLSWSTNNSDIAVVDENGMLTAKSSGMVTVTAATTDGSEISKSININIINHGYRYQNILEPTCTNKGKKKCTCRFCGYEYEEDIPALGHLEIIDKGYPATCTEKGLTDGKHCSRCETVLVEQTEIAATGHSYVDTDAKAATCSEEGHTAGKICQKCGDMKEGSVIKKLAHTEETIPAVAPTCTSLGKTEGKKCSVCGTVLVGQQDVAMLPHTSVVDPYVAPTTSSTGLTEGSHCSVCGQTIVRQTVIPVLKNNTSSSNTSGNNQNKATSKPASAPSTNVTPTTAVTRNKWVSTSSGRQYYKANGSVAKSEWLTINGTQYYFNSNGYTASNEWRDGKWISSDGSCTYKGKLQWKSNSTGWWIEDTAGWYPTSCSQKIDGIWYYFNSSGYMASGEYYNGYWYNSDGSRDDRYYLKWKSNSIGWWVEDKSGWWPSNSWLKVDGCWYYFNGSGYMVTNQYVDGWWIDSDGVCR